jgi:hypothetical protein
MIWAIRQTLIATVLRLVLLLVCCAGRIACADGAPAPLLESGHTVDWWFAFKFNSASFPVVAK